MKIIVDSREQLPFYFDKYECSTCRTALPAGDYSLVGFEDRIAIERKSLDDLVGCLMGADRERFERELCKAKSYDFFAVVVEASMEDLANGRYRSKMKAHSALQSVTAMTVRHRIPFMFAGNRRGAEYLTFSLLEKYLYEIEKRYKTATSKAA
jgi:DNA excision repair protein ERCC-4